MLANTSAWPDSTRFPDNGNANRLRSHKLYREDRRDEAGETRRPYECSVADR